MKRYGQSNNFKQKSLKNSPNHSPANSFSKDNNTSSPNIKNPESSSADRFIPPSYEDHSSDRKQNPQSNIPKTKINKPFVTSNKNLNSKNHNQEKSRIYALKIEIKRGVTRILRFTENNNPWAIAQNFCFQNGLDDTSIDNLANLIYEFKSQPLNNISFVNKVYKLTNLTTNNSSRYNTNHKKEQSMPDKPNISKIRTDLSKERVNFMKANDQYMVRPNSGKIGYGNISKTFEDEYNSAGCLTQTRGEDLYMRGVISQEKKRLQSQLKHKEEETLMKSRMNFTPHVNKSVGKAKSVYKQQNNIDFLGKVISDRELKKNQVKEKALQVEHEICTFQPKINKISNEIATKSFENYSQFGEQAASRFEHLYENSKVKHERQKFIKDSVMQNECPFKPQLYKPPKSVTKKVSTQTQLERAENHLKKAQMKKEMIEDIERIQLKTSFHPSIGRAPTDPTRPINVSIHNHLYNYRGVYDSKKNDLRQAQADMIKANQTVKVGMISDEIIENGMYEK